MSPPASADTRPRYSELAPGESLARWVDCYWTMRGVSTRSTLNRVLPDGCADIILGLGDMPGPIAVGTMRTAAVFPLSGAVDFFGVRFRAGCAAPFIGAPLVELTDARVPLDALWGGGAAALCDIPSAERVAHVERVLEGRLRGWMSRRRADESLAREAIRLMRRVRGGLTVRAAAAALGVGERRLERAFDRDVGIGPRAFGRVLRFRRTIRLVEAAQIAGAEPRWSSIAWDAGYADQSHLIREFRSLAGVTPTTWLAERRRVGIVQYGSEASA